MIKFLCVLIVAEMSVHSKSVGMSVPHGGDEVMTKYVRHMKSHATKSRSRAKCKRFSDTKTFDDMSRSSSGESGANPLGSRELDSAAPLSEVRVEQMVASHINQLYSSFSFSMEASFLNIEQLTL